MLRTVILSLTAAVFAIQPTAAQEARPRTVAIQAGRLVDVINQRMLTDQTIVIEGDRIVSVSPTAATSLPAGTPTIDLSTKTVLPGLVDTHVHLTSDPTVSYLESYHVTPARAAVFGAMNARRTLLAGFTVARNLSSEAYADVALRDGVERGDVMGPRIFAAGGMTTTCPVCTVREPSAATCVTRRWWSPLCRSPFGAGMLQVQLVEAGAVPAHVPVTVCQPPPAGGRSSTSRVAPGAFVPASPMGLSGCR